ncbi:SRPBCC domain-containing protein [bacterium]|nr:SRPBCC domain-containing protein [bacterium]
METKTGQETAVQVKRNFNAPREKVYKAWTDAGALSQWFAPTDDHKTTIEKLDVKEGGKYRIRVQYLNEIHHLTGEYLEVRPDEKLVYTWVVENEWEPSEVSQVTVEFIDRGNSTELILTHVRLPNEEQRLKHAEGWKGCLDHLETFFAKASKEKN